MSTTATKSPTLYQELKKADPDSLADAVRQVNLGKFVSPIKALFTLAVVGAALDVTTAAAKAVATITGIALDAGENLPPIRSVITLRVTDVTGGTGAAGPRVPTDAGGTATAPADTGPGIALLSDDGKTVTFEGTVKAFVIEYTPRSEVDPSALFARA